MSQNRAAIFAVINANNRQALTEGQDLVCSVIFRSPEWKRKIILIIPSADPNNAATVGGCSWAPFSVDGSLEAEELVGCLGPLSVGFSESEELTVDRRRRGEGCRVLTLELSQCKLDHVRSESMGS